jgi:hypothetical protein
MKLVAVVGSRKLPASWAGRVSQVVTDLVRRDCRIGSGGAMGADLLALQAVVHLGREACEGSRMFLPGSVMQAPSVSREWLLRFEALGGSVIQGPVAGTATTRSEYVSALFGRTVELVNASSGVVAFLSGASKGTWFTCEHAARSGKHIVLFSADGVRSIHSLGCGCWKPVGAWQGAYRWETSVPVGERCRHGIKVECCSSGMNRAASYPKETWDETD